MATRYNSTSRTNFGVPGLPSGYGGSVNPTLTIPPVGLEDVDVAVFNLLDKEIPFQVGSEGQSDMKNVSVVFAAGEKWAMLKRGRALRDKNNSLILPLITVGRVSVQQSMASDITGRGTNQQTGEIIVKRKLDASDRSYQNLVNRLFLEHQTTLAVPPTSGPDSGQLTTLRPVGDLESDPIVEAGGLLIPDHKNNVYETIALPAPQFYTATYEVTFWTQYTQHMNQLLEQLISSFLPQGQCWRLDTPKGYWFVANVEDNVFTAENNFDDSAMQERIIKYKFTIKVPAYVLASQTPGAPIAIKRYVSAPTVSFSIDSSTQLGNVEDPFLGADDPTLPLSDGSSRRRDNREVGDTKLYPNKTVNDNDPALLSVPRGHSRAEYQKITVVNKKGKLVTKYVRVVSVNSVTGETVFSSNMDLG